MNEIEAEDDLLPQEIMLKAWWEKTGVNLSHKAACAEAYRIGILAADGNEINDDGRTLAFNRLTQVLTLYPAEEDPEDLEAEQKMLQNWWEKTGLSLSHYDACDKAFWLGMLVGGGNYFNEEGRTVDAEGLPIELYPTT